MGGVSGVPTGGKMGVNVQMGVGCKQGKKKERP